MGNSVFALVERVCTHPLFDNALKRLPIFDVSDIPLTWAVTLDYDNCLQILVDAGADLNVQNAVG